MKGFARDEEEIQLGSYRCADPICDVAGRPVAAVSLSHMTAQPAPAEPAAPFFDTVYEAGRLISESLGNDLLPLAVGYSSFVPNGSDPAIDTPA